MYVLHIGALVFFIQNIIYLNKNILQLLFIRVRKIIYFFIYYNETRV